MVCIKCGEKLSEESIFCSKCGTKILVKEIKIIKNDIEKICPKCGKKLPKENIFCNKCGTEILVDEIKEIKEIKEVNSDTDNIADQIHEDVNEEVNVETSVVGKKKFFTPLKIIIIIALIPTLYLMVLYIQIFEML